MDRNDPDLHHAAVETVDAAQPSAKTSNWVDDLIAMTRPGLDMELPDRAFLSRIPPYGFDDFS